MIYGFKHNLHLILVSEEKFLQQLALEEQFGPVEKIEPQPIEGKKKVVGAAIGYNYGEGNATASGAGEPSKEEKISDDENDDDEDEEEDSDVDFGKQKHIGISLFLWKFHIISFLPF